MGIRIRIDSINFANEFRNLIGIAGNCAVVVWEQILVSLQIAPVCILGRYFLSHSEAFTSNHVSSRKDREREKNNSKKSTTANKTTFLDIPRHSTYWSHN